MKFTESAMPENVCLIMAPVFAPQWGAIGDIARAAHTGRIGRAR
ncbi:hypothetical protein [Paraburkholderia ferrariae]|nr:hypothetical protein [Paraburkholderia ferrariae]